MRHPLRLILAVAAFALAALSATTVLAAPTAWQTVDVTMHPEQSTSVLLVSGDLPESTRLPAEAELAVPEGSELQWIGEILGGPSSEDPAVEYTKSTANGMDIYRFTMTKSRTAQIEVPTTASTMFDGTSYASALLWRSPRDVPEVRLSLRVPEAAQVTKPVEGASKLPGDSGYSFYTKTLQNVKAGDKLEFAVAYTLPAVAAGAAGGDGGATASGSSSLVPILIVVAALAAGIALVVAIRRKMAGRALTDVDDGGEDSAQAIAMRSRAADRRAALNDNRTDAESPEEDASEQEDASAQGVQLAGKTRRNLATAAIIGVLIVAAVVVGMQTTRPQLSGDTISQTFAPGEACATVAIPLAVTDGADPKATAEKLFAAIKPIPGLNTATYNWKTSSIDIGYCDSSSSEDALRQALKPTGLLAQ